MSRDRFNLPESELSVRRKATDPGVHAWVSANAGSGKTSILRDRVMRLLVEGVAPDRILCLTFTKAAAAEMQNRIFSELARWASLPQTELEKAIEKLTGAERGTSKERAARLQRARRIFAEAVETPGGLKIQTIHAFAERILHLFPIEAGVPFDFAVLDDLEASILDNEARREALEAALDWPESELGRAFRVVTGATGLDGFARILTAATEALADFRNRHPGVASSQAMGDAHYAGLFGGDARETPEDVEREFAAKLPMGLALQALAAELDSLPLSTPGAGSTRARKSARRAAAAQGERERFRAMLELLLVKDETKARDRLLTQKEQKAIPGAAAMLDDLLTRVADFVARRRAARAIHHSRALRLFADHVLDSVSREKIRRNALDFDDLIARLARMLTTIASSWVMMKLDAEIEHILVDEAQDTTPAMWAIIGALSAEFFAGEGQAKKTRTLFVVGDEKQSIFSFQGARPEIFDAERQRLAAKFDPDEPAGAQLKKAVSLRYSFRSSGDVLEAVDRVFDRQAGRAIGLTAGEDEIEHKAADEHFPGLVELWPIVEPPAKPEMTDSDAPVDETPPDHPSITSARQVVDRIETMLAGERHLTDGAPIRPGDILILAQHRNRFFNAVLRELRQRKIPVAGADRLRLGEEIAIHDLVAVASAAIQPEDDLTLAAALKSPLLGLGDAEIELICRDRLGSARHALREKTAEIPALVLVEERLAELEARAATSAPYEFFAALLNEPIPGGIMSGRKAIYRRLGQDARDPLDAFLQVALDFERLNPPSLAAFLAANAAEAIEIKRDLDAGQGQVRVMTVHASKGLEARIVFLGDALLLPDKAKTPPAFLLDAGERELLVWHGGMREDEPEAMREARAAAHRDRLMEHRRLLYVAMTRAADRLYVTAFRRGAPPKEDKQKTGLDQEWHALVESAFGNAAEVEQVPAPDGDRPILRWRPQRKPRPFSEASQPEQEVSATIPDWLSLALPPEAKLRGPMAPSREVGASRANEEAGRARTFGIAWHRLFEHLPALPEEVRRTAAARMLLECLPGLSMDILQQNAERFERLIARADIGRFFGTNSRAEVPVSGTLTYSDGRADAVSGRIDRLIVEEDSVHILDIKTGPRRSRAENAGIHRQLGLYRALLMRVFLGRPVHAHILWVESEHLEHVPELQLDQALAGITVR